VLEASAQVERLVQVVIQLSKVHQAQPFAWLKERLVPLAALLPLALATLNMLVAMVGNQFLASIVKASSITLGEAAVVLLALAVLAIMAPLAPSP
jgi:hypothetical protein